MSDTPIPLEPEALDELLSAALDGELDAAARDLGLTTADAEARIRATPGADERRAALVSARDLLAETPDIDELLAARLRAKAVRAAEADTAARADERRRRRSRIALSVCGIAAALAGVVAVAAAVNGFQAGSSSSKSADAPSAADAAGDAATPQELAGGTTTVAAIGSFTDAKALAVAAVQTEAVTRTLESANRSKSALKPASTTVPGGYLADGKGSNGVASEHLSGSVEPPDVAKQRAGPKLPTTTTASGGREQAADTPGVAADHSTRFATSAPPGAACRIPAAVEVGDTPVIRTTATLSGKPVVVFVFSRGAEHVVVIEDTNCKLVNLQTFR